MEARTIRLAAAQREHRSAARRARLAGRVRLALVALVCLVVVAPFFYVITASFKDQSNLFQYPPQWIQWPPYLGNYRAVLVDQPFLRWTLNTLIYAGSVTLIKLVIDSMAGYAFARFEFRGRTVLFALFVATILVPPAALIIPLFFFVRSLGWQDTYLGLIVPCLANPVGVFMMRSFIEAVPPEIIQAARLDNAGELRIFRTIVLPLVRPGLVVLGIYVFLVQYTSFIWPLVITQSEDMRVLTTGMASMKTLFTVNWGLISAASVLALVPITLVYLMFQRQFVAASITGALKN
jgi:ABC-type glycerol-3-phosphate transport system permease component